MTERAHLRINGRNCPMPDHECETLLTTLRDRFALTGAKRGCNQGVCGACTVFVDGLPVRSCLTLSGNTSGSEIVTVEGLDDDKTAAALRKALTLTGAVQCGFCTPGMMVSATKLLRDTRTPTIAEIRKSLSGNLCRCSGYRKIVDAVRLAAEELRHG